MAYHPKSVEVLRHYQAMQRPKLTAYPAQDAAEEYAAAVEFQAGEPAGSYPSFERAVRREAADEARRLLKICREARETMRQGGWTGDDAPLKLAHAQAALWQAREYRRALLAAAADAGPKVEDAEPAAHRALFAAVAALANGLRQRDAGRVTNESLGHLRAELERRLDLHDAVSYRMAA